MLKIILFAFLISFVLANEQDLRRRFDKLFSRTQDVVARICSRGGQTGNLESCLDDARMCVAANLPPRGGFRGALQSCQQDPQFTQMMSGFRQNAPPETSGSFKPDSILTRRQQFRSFVTFLLNEVPQQTQQQFSCCMFTNLGLFQNIGGRYEFQLEAYKNQLSNSHLRVIADNCFNDPNSTPVNCQMESFKRCNLGGCIRARQEQGAGLN